MKVQDVRIEYGLGSAGAAQSIEPFRPGPAPSGLPAHFTRVHGSVMIRVYDAEHSAMLTVTSDRERLDEGFVDLCRALRMSLQTGDGWSRGVMSGTVAPSYINRDFQRLIQSG